MVCVMRHPRGLNFANERKVWHLRVQKNMSWESIAAEVVNLQGAPSTADLVKRAYKKFNGAVGRSVYKFARCGRKRWKMTTDVQHFILAKLLQIRKKQVCTSTTLQEVLAKEKGVNVSDATIRKFLRRKGYRWLPRAQKPAYSAMDQQLRLRFCKAVLRLSEKQLDEKLSLSMDGVILTIPPNDAIERKNVCRHGETHMYRRVNEAASPHLSGACNYPCQVPMARCVPLWGGISKGGCAEVIMHANRKLTGAEWAAAVTKGKLIDTIKRLSPSGKRPWHVLCDNERFLDASVSRAALARKGIKLWRNPPRSPDLNPVELFWSWLRRDLRRRDLEDLHRRREPPNKAAYRARARAVLRSKKAKVVAASITKSFRKTCQRLVDLGGAHSGS